MWQGEPYWSPDYFEHLYTVLNFETGQYYQLYDGSTHHRDRLDAHSETFYFVKRPVGPTARQCRPAVRLAGPQPGDPYDQDVFAQAIFAQLSADQTRACVVFPRGTAQANLGSTGLV